MNSTSPPKLQQANTSPPPLLEFGFADSRGLPEARGRAGPGTNGHHEGPVQPPPAPAPVGARMWNGGRRPERTAGSPQQRPHLFRASCRRTSLSSGVSFLSSSSSSSSSVPARHGAFTTSPKNVAAIAASHNPGLTVAPQEGAGAPAHAPEQRRTLGARHAPPLSPVPKTAAHCHAPCTASARLPGSIATPPRHLSTVPKHCHAPCHDRAHALGPRSRANPAFSPAV